MKKTVTVISGIILILGCLTMGASLLASSILPNAFLVYLTANPSSFSHEILHPNMAGPYIFSIAEMIIGIIGIFYFGPKYKDVI